LTEKDPVTARGAPDRCESWAPWGQAPRRLHASTASSGSRWAAPRSRRPVGSASGIILTTTDPGDAGHRRPGDARPSIACRIPRCQRCLAILAS
jgi:hypothetical protein